tara:strand:- start:238 stop:486 length:249 start_codon:yes stop_codon:yes gene_type:complete
MFKKIKTTTKKILQEINTPEYKKYLIIAKQWEEKIDEKIKKNAKIIDYKNQKITIKTKNPTWKNEIVFLKEEIKKNYRPQKF